MNIFIIPDFKILSIPYPDNCTVESVSFAGNLCHITKTFNHYRRDGGGDLKTVIANPQRGCGDLAGKYRNIEIPP